MNLLGLELKQAGENKISDKIMCFVLIIQ